MTIPAWKADSVAAFLAELARAFKSAKGSGDPNGAKLLEGISADASAWKPLDRWCVRGGVVLLAGSFLLKMLHHCGYIISA